MLTAPVPHSRRWLIVALTTGATLLALLPWWRNHGYLRDFYDYGLVIAGVSRISAGERPYVDFVTPIQSGTFWFNAIPEKLGGDTYQAMTLGAAALILLSLPALAWLLARRLPWWTAIPLAGAVVIGSASQHTIVWHNAVGVLCLAAVAWASALAPVLRRADWPLHLAVAGALCLGGMNKINFHLVALTVAVAWTLRAVLLQRASWQRGLGTLAFVSGAGALLPVATELIWTGSSLGQWWGNVVALAAGSRAEYFRALCTTDFYLEPQHNFYGALLLPQIGLAMVVLVGATGIVLLLTRRALDRVLAAGAVLFALVASLALLATNHEIAYFGFTTAAVLSVALWLGFGVTKSPSLTAAVLVVPVLLGGAAAWQSAWQGQRSQFGHSTAARSAYRDPSVASPELAYLRGTLVPPEICDSLEGLAATLPPPNEAGLRPVFYGPGLEWFERVCPAVKVPQLPLWLHNGTSYGRRQRALLATALSTRGQYQQVLVPNPWDAWPDSCRLALELRYTATAHGPVLQAYQAHADALNLANALPLLNQLGGNLHPAFLTYDPRVSLRATAGDQYYFGRDSGTTTFHLRAPSNRLAGTAVLQRMPGGPAGVLRADFAVYYATGDNPECAWRQTLELPAGADEASVDYQIDCRQQGLDFTSTIQPPDDGRLCAGWTVPRILHSLPDSAPPPSLFPSPHCGRWLTPPEAQTAAPPQWHPDAVFLRGGTVAADHFELPPGGELWLRADKPLAELLGRVRISPDQPTSRMPVVRLVWQKGGRVEILAQTNVRPQDRQLELRAWSAEPEGWIGILIDPVPGTPPALVQIDSARLSE